jgi:hypothetical protein
MSRGNVFFFLSKQPDHHHRRRCGLWNATRRRNPPPVLRASIVKATSIMHTHLPKRRYEMRREGNKLERGEVKTLPVDLLSRGHHASHYNRLQYAIFSVKANRPVISFGSFIPTSFSFLHTYKYISMVSCCTLFFTKWPYINTANAKRVVHSQIQMPSPSVTATLQTYDSHLTTSERESHPYTCE